MKIHHLEITGIGPYAGTEEIDFDGLNAAGVHLLTGPTGAGKSTVLDAIAFAIFGRIPRHGSGRADLTSDHLAEGTVPRVVLEATIGSSRLRITRSPDYERRAKRGDGMTTEGQKVALEEMTGGEWKSISGAWREANEDLERRVGMSPEQFSQVVMLPQGEFATFLKAEARERRHLLERLFPTQDFSHVENWLKQRANEDRERRDEKLREIEDRIESVKPVVENAAAEGLEGIGEIPDPGEAAPLNTWIKETGEALAKVSATADRARKKAVETSEAREAELNRLRKKAELVTERGLAEDRLAKLKEQEPRRKALGGEIDAAQRAAAVAPLAEAAAKRAGELEEMKQRHELLQKDLLEMEGVASAEPEQLEKLAAGISEETATIVNFEKESQPKRRQLAERVAELKEEQSALEQTGPGSELGLAVAKLEQESEKRKLARAALIKTRTARTHGMAAELAGELVEGEPCAVCGSTEHPTPAMAEGEVVTQEDEDRAIEADEAAEKSEAEAKLARDRIKEKIEARRTEVKTELTSSTRELEGLLKRETELTGNAASLTERRESLQALTREINEFLQLDGKLTGAAATSEQAAKEALEAARANDFESLEAAARAAVPPDTLKAKKAEAREYDDGLAAVNERLGGELKEIDRNEKSDLGPAEEAAAGAKAERDRCMGTWSTADERSSTFREQTGPVPGLHEELAPLRDTAARSNRLKRLVNGENERKMQLSIFVLAARLRQVIEAANVRLRQMSGDRYELIYSGDRRGNAISGLGIEVMDAYTSESRPTSTLSGGESFYASLALALGLAEVVQQESGGRRLDTLFIDEGFGTLDSETLDQVMNVIDSLREGGRAVGLVSHVEELRGRIPAQIQVTKKRTGSTITVTGI